MSEPKAAFYHQTKFAELPHWSFEVTVVWQIDMWEPNDEIKSLERSNFISFWNSQFSFFLYNQIRN